jgi:hypothetical protein
MSVLKPPKFILNILPAAKERVIEDKGATLSPKEEMFFMYFGYVVRTIFLSVAIFWAGVIVENKLKTTISKATFGDALTIIGYIVIFI